MPESILQYKRMTIEQEIKLQASYAYDEGMALDISQGVHDKAVEMAKSAIAMGLCVEQVVKLTGLSVEEVKQIAKENI